MVLTGLIPLSNYSISAAAVNQNGDVGPYSDPVTERTQNYCEPQKAHDFSQLALNTLGPASAPIVVGVASGLIGGTFIAKRR